MIGYVTEKDAPKVRTRKGLLWDEFYKGLHEKLDSDDPKTVAEVKAAKEQILRAKATPGAVQQSSLLETMSVMYANDDFVGTRLMPVVMTKGRLSGSYYVKAKRDGMAAPDDSMATRSRAAELTRGLSTSTFALSPRALQEVVDDLVIQVQDAPLSELVDAQMHVLDSMELKREQRLATILCTNTNYGANTTAVAAADRWNGATGGDPGGLVDTAKDACWRGNGPGSWLGFCDNTVWNVLKRHPRIRATYPNYDGVLTTTMVADFLELDELIVGRARQDTANAGQTATYTRIWSAVFGVLRVAQRPTLNNASWGYTLQAFPNRQDLWYEIGAGSQGAWHTRMSRQDQELTVCTDCGYLYTTPVN